jgi:peptidoglycan/xylan/chitin deacetylase (PgdA/CDA1 family)
MTRRLVIAALAGAALLAPHTHAQTPPPPSRSDFVKLTGRVAWLETIPTANASTTRTLVKDYTANEALGLADFANATGAAVSYDTAKGAQKVAWTSCASGSSQYSGVKITGPWDLSSSSLFTLDVAFPKNEVNTRVYIAFNFDTGTTWTNYAVIGTVGSGLRKLRQQTLAIPKSALTVTGVANWAAVQRIEIRLYCTAAAETFARSMYVYGLWANVAARPRVVLSFDDNTASDYTVAYPALKAAGMRATLYTNGSHVGQANYVSLAQLQQMYADGWDVGNHTWDHTAVAQSGSLTASGTTATFTCSNTADAHGLTVGKPVTISGADEAEYNGTFTVATVPNAYTFTYTMGGTPASPGWGWMAMQKPPGVVRETVQRNTDWLVSHGFTRGREHFAYPQGYFDDASIALLQSMGFRTGRTTDQGPAPFFVPTHAGLADPFHIPVIELNNTQTAANVLAKVDAAITSNATLFIYGHKLVASPTTATEFSTTEFATLVAGLKSRRDAGQVDVVTMTDWYNHL